jgi:Xaa-Pro aminopeptidase
MPHYRASKGKLEKGQPIQIDIGVIDRHYHSDMSRVVFFGKPSSEMRKIYDIVLKAQLAALNQCRPGIKIGDLDQTAREIISKAGYGDKFTHSLGHGVGLEIHESPLLRNKPPHSEEFLQPGMVITIEPGIYLSGIGGVRIEDTVVITDDGYENLTNRPKEMLIID